MQNYKIVHSALKDAKLSGAAAASIASEMFGCDPGEQLCCCSGEENYAAQDTTVGAVLDDGELIPGKRHQTRWKMILPRGTP